MTGWLHIQRGEAPLVVALPHGGTGLGGIEDRFVSPWLARRDADWHIAELYAFAADLGATTIATQVSRSVIDVNRDPSGASLYPGMATTELCPTTTFDGDRLYRCFDPEEDEISWRRRTFFDPYHAAVTAELERLNATHGKVVLYDAHSIRSRVPRLFDGELPQFNIGTNSGASCDQPLARQVAGICGSDCVIDGRFKGGWTTRHYGHPERGIHAVQMELAMRGYMIEPAEVTPGTWPTPLLAQPEILPILHAVLTACIAFAKGSA
ncbi:N-formylglutamate deformylase [Novosphingobium sp.]|uniref:N-formylglutamate deformylase n=1 Tax=Novosphingobium sp. TaxID=1874826 RepID=UPI0025E3F567|nr:N-formylglutamate deformylase [Novosphingobium sp.]